MSSFSLEFDLWPTGTVSASAASAYDTSIQNAPIGVGDIYTTNGAATNVHASVTVIALQRAPLVLMNLSGEVENLSGYGYRYTGEQRFYSFYVNLPNGPSAPTQSDPFQSGVNLVLESRSAFLNSTLGSTLNGSNGLPPSITNCFGSSAQVTTQNPGSTDFTSIVGSFSANQVATSCAMTLLGELEPLSANRTNHDPPMGGTYIFLSSVQAELLGLDSQALTLMPFQSPPTSPTGGPPTNDLGSAFGYVVGAFAFAYNALVTGVNFIAHLPAELKALGQFILGAIEKVLSAVEAAVQWLANALDFLLQLVVRLFDEAINLALAPFSSEINSIGTQLVTDFLSIAYGMKVIPSVAVYDDLYTNVTGAHSFNRLGGQSGGSPLTLQASTTDLLRVLALVADTVAVIQATDAAIEWSDNVETEGIGFVVEGAFIDGAEPAVQQAIIKAVTYQLTLSAIGAAAQGGSIFSSILTGSNSTISTALRWTGIGTAAIQAVATALTHGNLLFSEVQADNADNSVIQTASFGVVLGVAGMIVAAISFLVASNPIVEMALGATAMALAGLGYVLMDLPQTQLEVLAEEDRISAKIGQTNDIVSFLAGTGALLAGAANYA